MNGFARRLVLKQRERVTRKWPIVSVTVEKRLRNLGRVSYCSSLWVVTCLVPRPLFVAFNPIRGAWYVHPGYDTETSSDVIRYREGLGKKPYKNEAMTLLGIKQKTRSHIVRSNGPISDCQMRFHHLRFLFVSTVANKKQSPTFQLFIKYNLGFAKQVFKTGFSVTDSNCG